MNNIDLESERLTFKRVSNEHISNEYVSWINDPEVNMYIETRGNYTLELLKAYVEEQYKNEIFFWAIHLKSTKKHIGNIKIDPIDYKTNFGDYGILMGDKTNWGKGYGKEATLRILDYCFNEIKLSKVKLGVIEDNNKAVELYKNIGFKIDGVTRDIGVYNNKLCNSLNMSLDVEDFK
ncbi:GNAT family N-acetyltransferase [Winogradskyella sp. PG-2]|uniref:GNAT family N-acetyltransferase n=1 Tax=Winogradskyella sp. PG-2 TaxID=754409 RepID=UPI0004587D96|nr:GNAT family protein [Winogradskyella sp. PG-2]BAO75060.1 ribosomal-protein-S5p-alanine acetyltransferase [Winogradskyella sp. PG-2]